MYYLEYINNIVEGIKQDMKKIIYFMIIIFTIVIITSPLSKKYIADQIEPIAVEDGMKVIC